MGISNRYTCAKCEANDVCVDHVPKWEPDYPGQKPRYHNHERTPADRSNLEEHLCLTCRECGYEWTTLPRDALRRIKEGK